MHLFCKMKASCKSPKTVIPEAILIGNPASNWLKLWIPDKYIRGDDSGVNYRECLDSPNKRLEL